VSSLSAVRERECIEINSGPDENHAYLKYLDEKKLPLYIPGELRADDLTFAKPTVLGPRP